MDFANPAKNPDGIGTFSVYGENYRTKWTKITNQLYTVNYSADGEEFILESNHNHLTYAYAPKTYSAEDSTDLKAEEATIEAFREYATDASHYEDM